MHTYMHVSYAPLARAVVRDAIDLSPRVALTSWIFSYSFQPAACPDATNSTDTAIDPTNACEYIYRYMYIYVYYLNAYAYMRVCVYVALPRTISPTKFLDASPPTRCIHSSVCTTGAACMHVSAIIITRIPIVNYRSTRFPKKAHGGLGYGSHSRSTSRCK